MMPARIRLGLRLICSPDWASWQRWVQIGKTNGCFLMNPPPPPLLDVDCWRKQNRSKLAAPGKKQKGHHVACCKQKRGNTTAPSLCKRCLCDTLSHISNSLSPPAIRPSPSTSSGLRSIHHGPSMSSVTKFSVLILSSHESVDNNTNTVNQVISEKDEGLFKVSQ